MECPVVKVKFDNEQGYYLLNESDFDETKHELFTEEAPKVEAPKVEAPKDATSPTTGDDKAEQTAPAAKTPDAGAATAKPAWVSKKSKS